MSVCQCPQCGEHIPAGNETCEKCGAPIASLDAALSEEEIHRLLAEANLYRIRKQPEDAISVCTRVLRLDPTNAAAHSLMGDIHRDAGNLKEALGWFKLAVQLNPKNQTDRKKLDEMIDRVFKSVANGEQESFSDPAMELQAAGKPSRPLGHQLRNYLSRITPTHVIIASVILAVIAGISIANPFRAMSSKVPPSQVQDAPPAATLPGQEMPMMPPSTAHAPYVVPPPPDPVEGGKLPGLPITVVPNSSRQEQNSTPGNSAPETTLPPKTTVEPQPTGAAPSRVSQVPPFEPQGRTSMGAEELEQQTAQLHAALEEALRTSKLPSALNGVTIDPRTRVATIYFTVPPMEGPTQTKQGLLYSGFHLVWTAEKSGLPLKSYTICGYAYPDPAKDPTKALLADVTPQQADDAREAGDYQAVAKHLTNPWWREDLDAASL